ncbi:LysR family transcriptional regulator ArgP [Nitrincola alkalilacustris]|uniref:LysR family transcriptional regulator ArgP n=1 Tax=Nitrincola alkalilacustris TaxID=1571224 RepID=UPI00124C7BC4|nr:LysR family transcriptional regulator ArgP [Nitrincola alkalilacustris]
MIDYRLLSALAAVIEQRGFEKAAQKLHLTQSAISQRIRQLENQMGQPVLQRSTPPKPTDLGIRLNNHYQQVRQLEAGLGLVNDRMPRDLVIRLTVNADSLATWLAQALAASHLRDEVTFDLVVEDQDVGLSRMRRGEVMACLCAEGNPVNGGKSVFLGNFRYRALASPDFISQYRLHEDLLQGLQQAPCLIFNNDDQLQHRFLQQAGLGAPARVHFCPSSEGFMQLAQAGLGYGMMPELQADSLIKKGLLCDIQPDYCLDVPLYWHYWQTESPVMRRLREGVIQTAKHFLRD